MFSPSVKDTIQPQAGASFTRQGSLRKVLPPVETPFGPQHEELNHIYKLYKREYVILAEYKMLEAENIQGVYAIPSKENPLVWFGIVFVREGPYKDGVFRFTLTLDEEFPDSDHPNVIFSPIVPHPLIDPTSGQLNLLGGFRKWDKTKQHLWQVFKYIQWIFVHIEASAAHGAHPEALELLSKNKEEFVKQAEEAAKNSKQHIYTPSLIEDPHYIQFEPYDRERHKKDKLLNFLKEKEQKKSRSKGPSWVLPNSLEPLGRPPTPEDFASPK
ncbi:protein crossbronx homolog [Anthonomus grandis grandis]|uniref:protein crossbronx homolog n=1 Tax=Anthonomus grandis grandis TaxID=2921223 RepID=UPI002165C089|nr:protein crossbronx homolog [Anthonomus grandis grandis]